MSTRQDYITAISQLVSGELPLGEPEKIFAIIAALKKYSSARPRESVAEIDGNGTTDYALTTLTDFSEGFSGVKQVEYPVDTVLDDDDWSLIRKTDGRYLRLASSPAATEKIRVLHTALHACDDEQCSIPTFDEEAVQMLAASFFCDMLAAYFAQTQDSTIGADSVDHKSKASEYAARARAYRQNYYNHLGFKEGEKPPVSVTHNQDTRPSWQTDHLTHGRRWR
jgi:hypothetical protein